MFKLNHDTCAFHKCPDALAPSRLGLHLGPRNLGANASEYLRNAQVQSQRDRASTRGEFGGENGKNGKVPIVRDDAYYSLLTVTGFSGKILIYDKILI